MTEAFLPKLAVSTWIPKSSFYFQSSQLEYRAETTKEKPVAAAFLVGEIHRKDGEEFLFINGALQISDIRLEGKDVIVGDDVWKRGTDECKKYFEGKLILGWFLVAPELASKVTYNISKQHDLDKALVNVFGYEDVLC